MQTSHQVLQRAAPPSSQVAKPPPYQAWSAHIHHGKNARGEEDISVLVIKLQVFFISNVLTAGVQTSHQVLCRTTCWRYPHRSHLPASHQVCGCLHTSHHGQKSTVAGCRFFITSVLDLVEVKYCSHSISINGF